MDLAFKINKIRLNKLINFMLNQCSAKLFKNPSLQLSHLKCNLKFLSNLLIKVTSDKSKIIKKMRNII